MEEVETFLRKLLEDKRIIDYGIVDVDGTNIDVVIKWNEGDEFIYYPIRPTS